MLRTHACGEVSEQDVSKTVTLCGWVDTLRVSGKIAFLLLRDRTGIIQIFLDKTLTEKYQHELKKESVVLVEGLVNKRPDNQVKQDMKTGAVEIAGKRIEILNKAEPLPLDFNIESSEETRLKFRYLDLRRSEVRDKLIMRHKMMKVIHAYMDAHEFIELETPILAKSTPEGARDYLVPSRTDKGKFFALPQSPQLFKQLFMIAGMEKYYQIARCLRDEDLRADRQPEFTQLDIEMSFIDEEDIINLLEGLMKKIFKEVLHVDIKIPFERLPYDECMKKYKSDKPDLRKTGEDFRFLWVVDFPLMEYSEEEKKFVSTHHPFTSPKAEDLPKLDSKKLEGIKARAYDLVLNGFEIGGGSIRIHDPQVQRKIFEILQLTQKEIDDKFGFFVNALKYGAPPHGGIALGLDRIAAIITKSDSIRDVIAFPKNKDAKDLMLDSPSSVSEKQLHELGIKISK
ncbi:MAG TPA: aspartate--tRNA ligase [Candidatus Nanoarchaeia archaeon]|nr:aspartate--tRNA ligase [Candidatus Nanoarchaeia archaeon]